MLKQDWVIEIQLLAIRWLSSGLVDYRQISMQTVWAFSRNFFKNSAIIIIIIIIIVVVVVVVIIIIIILTKIKFNFKSTIDNT